jgi:uncharacterized protein YlxP (DUF503 family)
MSGLNGFVAVLVVDLHFPEAGSLKGKRKDLQSIKSIVQGRFGAAVSEVAFHDLWQRARLLACIAGGSAAIVTERAEHLERWLDSRSPAGAGIERMIVSVDDLRDVISSVERGG